MQLVIANQQTSDRPTAGIAGAVIHRIRHPEDCPRVDEHIASTARVLDNAAANFLQLLGGCQLLAAKPGADLATASGSNLSDRDKPSVRKQLEVRLALENIWVHNGPESYGLTSLRFLERGRAISFIRHNPELAGTLIMAAQNEVVLMVLIEGAKLPSAELPGLKIQSTGELLLFDRSPGEAPSSFIQYKHPLTTDLRKIKWDPDHEQALLPTIVEVFHGPFSLLNRRGKLVPNCKAWAAYITKITQIVFSRVDGHFYLRGGETGKWAPQDQAELECLAQKLIKDSPLPDLDKAAANDAASISKIIRTLKRVAVGDSPVFDQVILEFIADTLELCQRFKVNAHTSPSNFTIGELHELCRAYALEHGKPVVPLTIFQRRIRRLMSGPPLYLPKSQSVKRNGKDQNGFRGVRVKQPGFADVA